MYEINVFISNCNAFSFDTFWILFVAAWSSVLSAYCANVHLKSVFKTDDFQFYILFFSIRLIRFFLLRRSRTYVFVLFENGFHSEWIHGSILIALDEWWNNYNYGYYWFDRRFFCCWNTLWILWIGFTFTLNWFVWSSSSSTIPQQVLNRFVSIKIRQVSKHTHTHCDAWNWNKKWKMKRRNTFFSIPIGIESFIFGF